MPKNKTPKIVNTALLLLLINQVVTGMLGMKLSTTFFEWGHRRAAWLLITAAAVHLAMNWNWIKANYFEGK
ncbi:MAG: hypothetical protein OEV87_13400 [Phycisphaerae bacterium]|nr:hypothetical protein [Phycisphaerae bacterium]